ncbi:hypothetical protein, partial [Endozoicomonas sp. ALB122]|uniref:hypothetical protein n=1 Tax=Endozoicomonas sp. ALB122 TaxID=3403075 RepID=UPI003BB7CA65
DENEAGNDENEAGNDENEAGNDENEAGNDGREHVKRRKISGGTKSEGGRRSRDTFASLTGLKCVGSTGCRSHVQVVMQMKPCFPDTIINNSPIPVN